MGKVNSTTTSNQNASTNNVKEECIMKTNKTQKATATVSVGDLDITRDNAPDESITEPVDNRNAKAKTDRLFALLKNYAVQNEKNGYGYTISSYMLQACILDAGAGVKKFKGHKITSEEHKMSHKVYTWLKDKGYIKPCVYSVAENPDVRVYTPDYTGKTDTKNLIPFAKSKGYNAKQVTIFVVTVR